MPLPSLHRDVLRRYASRLRDLRCRRAHSVKSDPPPGKSTPGEGQIPTPNTIPTLPFWQRLGPLTRAAQAYGRYQRKRPLTTQLCSSLVIFFASDISAQSMGGRDYDPTRTVRSLIIGGVSSIPSYKWFVWLSHSFNYASRTLSLLTKVAVNQVLFAPTFNTFFFGAHAALAGESFDAVVERLKQTIEYRSLFSGFIAVGWQTYLSFLNRMAEDKARMAENALSSSSGQVAAIGASESVAA